MISFGVVLLAATAYQLVAAPLYAVDVAGVGRVGPDFVLVAVAALSVRARSTLGPLAAAIGIGLALDGLSADPFLTRTTASASAALAGTRCGRHGLEASAFPCALHLAAATGLGTLAGIGWLHATAFSHLAPEWGWWGVQWAYHFVLGVILLALIAPLVDPGRSRVKAWYAGG